MNSVFPFIRILLVTIAASCLLATGQAGAAPKPGQSPPDFKVVSTTGQTVTLDNYTGRILIIDFFAPWCQPCRQSIPHLVEMQRKYGRQGLNIFGLSADVDGEGGVRTFADEYRINYPLALAGEATTEAFGVRSLPVTFIIDSNGNIAEVYYSYSEEVGRSMERLIKRLLTEK